LNVNIQRLSLMLPSYALLINNAANAIHLLSVVNWVLRSPIWYQFCLACCFQLASSLARISSISTCKVLIDSISSELAFCYRSCRSLVFCFSWSTSFPNFWRLHRVRAYWHSDNLLWTESMSYHSPKLKIRCPAIHRP
jgi:hypothetical protein